MVKKSFFEKLQTDVEKLGKKPTTKKVKEATKELIAKRAQLRQLQQQQQNIQQQRRTILSRVPDKIPAVFIKPSENKNKKPVFLGRI
jgi:predicted transcriptional regulator